MKQTQNLSLRVYSNSKTFYVTHKTHLLNLPIATSFKFVITGWGSTTLTCSSLFDQTTLFYSLPDNDSAGKISSSQIILDSHHLYLAESKHQFIILGLDFSQAPDIVFPLNANSTILIFLMLVLHSTILEENNLLRWNVLIYILENKRYKVSWDKNKMTPIKVVLLVPD